MSAAAAIGWQDIALALVRNGEKNPRRVVRAQRGNRRIPQDTVKAIRADVEAGMKKSEVALKYQVSQHFVYAVTTQGIRDDEREVFR